MSFMLGTKDEVLTLSADDSKKLYWHAAAAFGAHSDMKSNTGGTFSMVHGDTPSSSTKQKVNSRSSIEVELITVEDKISKVI